MPPIHAREVYGSVDRELRCGAEGFLKKSDKGSARRLARRHDKVVMLHGPASDHAVDGHVVGWVEERHMGTLTSEQAAQIITTSRIAAPEAVLAELPQIAKLRDSRTGETTLVDRVSGIRCRILKVSMPGVDLGGFEARDRDVEIILEQKFGEGGEL